MPGQIWKALFSNATLNFPLKWGYQRLLVSLLKAMKSLTVSSKPQTVLNWLGCLKMGWFILSLVLIANLSRSKCYLGAIKQVYCEHSVMRLKYFCCKTKVSLFPTAYCVCKSLCVCVLLVQSLCPVRASSLNACQTSVCRPASLSVTLQETHIHTDRQTDRHIHIQYISTRAQMYARVSWTQLLCHTHTLKKHVTELYLLWLGCMKKLLHLLRTSLLHHYKTWRYIYIYIYIYI